MMKQPLTFVLVVWLIAVASQFATAVETIPDEPFLQEYRDPFVLGETEEENNVRAVTVDPQGRVWAATAAGIRFVNGDKLVPVADESIDGPTFDVAVDAAGTIWVAAWNGVYKIVDGNVERVNGLDGPVTVVCPQKGRVIVGGLRGVSEYADQQWKSIPGPWQKNIRDIAIVDRQLNVVTPGGLFRANGSQITLLSRPDELLSSNLRAAAVGRDGTLWLGSRGGLDAYRGERRAASYIGRDGLPSTDVRSLSVDGEGVVWVGTAIGAARFDGKRWSFRHSRRWLPDDEVRDVAFAADGAAWIATRGGLSVIRKRSMTLADKAVHFQDIVRKRHVRAPGLMERCRMRVLGDLSTFEPMDTDNDGMYTGLYLVAEAHRYAVTGAADAKANAAEAFAAMEFLQTVTGTSGFVARTVVPSDWTSVADGNRAYTDQEVAERLAREARWKKVTSRWRKSDDGKWLWKGDTSSDEISGHYFAYAVYYDLVAEDAEKKRVAQLVRRITDHIIEGGFDLRDIDGKSTRWGVWSPEKLNDDPDWWLEKGVNSLEILSYLSVAHHITGDEKYRQAMRTLLEKHHYAENILTPIRATPDYFTYIGFQLLAFSYPALVNYESDPALKQLYLKSVEKWFAPVRDDASPFYGFVYGALTGGDFRQRDCVELLRDVPLDAIEWTVDNSRREDLSIVERPVEGVQQTSRLLPPSERGIFRWDRNVYQVRRGNDGRAESSTAFWLAPYWMGRYYGFIGAPQ